MALGFDSSKTNLRGKNLIESNEMQEEDHKVDRVVSAILALVLWIVGLIIIRGGGTYSHFYARYWDYGEFHIALGVIFLGLGAWSAYNAFRKHRPSRR